MYKIMSIGMCTPMCNASRNEVHIVLVHFEEFLGTIGCRIPSFVGLVSLITLFRRVCTKLFSRIPKCYHEGPFGISR